MIARVCFMITFVLFSFTISAQDFDGLYRKKVKTLDSTIETLYSVISGDAGVRRDWKLFKYLFADDAKLIPFGQNQNGRSVPRFMSADDYIETAGNYLYENGFFEKEIHRVTETFGALTHIFSTYESYRSSKGTEPFARGINSIQLIYDGSRWWIINIAWQSENSSLQIPAQYLKN